MVIKSFKSSKGSLAEFFAEIESGDGASLTEDDHRVIAASVRADPYSVVISGLGVIGGPLHGAASSAVHEMFAESARLDDAAQAVGEVLRPYGRVPGFRHTLYTHQDPRYSALMTLVVEAWADDPRLQHVYRVRDVVGARRDEFPNVDLALGAFTWLAGMAPGAGETIVKLSRMSCSILR